MNHPLRLFISSAPPDAPFRDTFLRHLAGLRRAGRITVWADNQIAPGMIWNEIQKSNLQQADIVALLLSNDFMASDRIWDNELQNSLERRAKGEAVLLLPIFVRPCLVKNTVLEQIQGLPRNQVAVSSHHDQDDAWYRIVLEINDLLEQFPQITAAAQQSISTHPAAPQNDISIIGGKNIISGSIIIVGGNLTIGDT